MAVLTLNVYMVWWLDKKGHFKEEQVEARTMQIAKNKARRLLHAPKTHVGVRLLIRKGKPRPYGMRATK